MGLTTVIILGLFHEFSNLLLTGDVELIIETVKLFLEKSLSYI